jgi:hypothetical protein
VGQDAFDPQQFEVWDWSALGINVMNECAASDSSGLSIHDGLEQALLGRTADVVYYDHGSGEMADFVEILPYVNGEDGDTLVRFYHCKATKSKTAGGRVNDAYDVCGQAAKSLSWARKDLLLESMARRLKRKHSSRYVRGTRADAERLLGRRNRVVLEIVVVQPGFSKAKLGGDLGLLLAAASEYLVTGPCLRLVVIGSP